MAVLKEQLTTLYTEIKIARGKGQDTSKLEAEKADLILQLDCQREDLRDLQKRLQEIQFRK